MKRVKSKVCTVLIPYCLVLLCLLCQCFASLLALEADLLALQLLQSCLIFLLGGLVCVMRNDIRV